MIIDWSQCPVVERHPDRMGGVWTFADTRVPVTFLFDNLDSGATIRDFVDWFEGVTAEQVHSVLAFVARSAGNRAVA